MSVFLESGELGYLGVETESSNFHGTSAPRRCSVMVSLLNVSVNLILRVYALMLVDVFCLHE